MWNLSKQRIPPLLMIDHTVNWMPLKGLTRIRLAQPVAVSLSALVAVTLIMIIGPLVSRFTVFVGRIESMCIL